MSKRKDVARQNKAARAVLASLGFSEEELAFDYESTPKSVLRVIARTLQEEYQNLTPPEQTAFDAQMSEFLRETLDAVTETTIAGHASMFRLAAQQYGVPAALRNIMASIAETLEALAD